MKKFSQIIALTVAIAAVALTPSTQAQTVDVSYVQPGLRTLLLFTNSVSNATVTATTRTKLNVPPHAIPAIQTTYFAANPGTSNLVIGFSSSLDGVNWGTTRTYVTNALSGTNVLVTVNILGTNLPARFIAIDSIGTTQTNLVTLTNASLVFFPY